MLTALLVLVPTLCLLFLVIWLGRVLWLHNKALYALRKKRQAEEDQREEEERDRRWAMLMEGERKRQARRAQQQLAWRQAELAEQQEMIKAAVREVLDEQSQVDRSECRSEVDG